MADQLKNPAPKELEVSDLPPIVEQQTVLLSAKSSTGPKQTPQKIIYFYSPDEWEEFILEWARATAAGYVAVKRIGGANDKGADVAAFLTRQGFEGDWHCFQCKHYENSLMPSNAWPEILKVFRAAVEGYYVLPTRYVFHAPKGCGPTLDRLLSTPSKLKDKFLGQLAEDDRLVDAIDAPLLSGIIDLAKNTDFSMFESADLDDVLQVHATTANYARRFGMPPKDRSATEEPPSEIKDNESRYVDQLVDIYRERFSTEVTSLEAALGHVKCSRHFKRQREAFYSAEALRLFARDSVPHGTFEALQEGIYDGVVETEERIFPDGWERLTAVLEQAVSVSLNSNALVTYADTKDRKGICHQLANEDRLKWMS
ncbi:ABC-three component system protein [Streptomyces sp. NPDC059466]|uniref:ABC-three component system protein n=1 Tax=unclassified Streptomyces TaxID=2593676 RepID=UPI0036A0CEEE